MNIDKYLKMTNIDLEKEVHREKQKIKTAKAKIELLHILLNAQNRKPNMDETAKAHSRGEHNDESV